MKDVKNKNERKNFFITVLEKNKYMYKLFDERAKPTNKQMETPPSAPSWSFCTCPVKVKHNREKNYLYSWHSYSFRRTFQGADLMWEHQSFSSTGPWQQVKVISSLLMGLFTLDPRPLVFHSSSFILRDEGKNNMKSDQVDVLWMISRKYFFLNSVVPFQKKRKVDM